MGQLLKILYTGYWNTVGLPSLSIPMGLTAGGLPLGLQSNGPAPADALVLRAGDAFQRLTTHHLARPAITTAAVWTPPHRRSTA